MQEITSYIYDNIIEVVYAEDPSELLRNRLVYARTIDLYRGIDNIFKIRVLNDHQRSVNITNKILQFIIVDDTVNKNPVTIINATITIVDATKGIGQITLARNNIDVLTKNQYNWAIRIRNSDEPNFTPTYVNDNWGAYGQLRVNSSSFPTTSPQSFDLGEISDGVRAAVYDLGDI